jgi:hypothetical protein
VRLRLIDVTADLQGAVAEGTRVLVSAGVKAVAEAAGASAPEVLRGLVARVLGEHARAPGRPVVLPRGGRYEVLVEPDRNTFLVRSGAEADLEPLREGEHTALEVLERAREVLQ